MMQAGLPGLRRPPIGTIQIGGVFFDLPDRKPVKQSRKM
jgi:hypothetical protein